MQTALHYGDGIDNPKTADFGQTWTKISDALPKGPLAYARVITENPNRKGMLFAGTGNALFYSLDDGGHWTNLQTGLPHSPVSVPHQIPDVEKALGDLPSGLAVGAFDLLDIAAFDEAV